MRFGSSVSTAKGLPVATAQKAVSYTHLDVYKRQDWYLTTKKDIQNLIKIRKNFSHKGTYGHALIVAGNTTTMGAALLAANACLHSGAGLTTVCLPESGLIALNTALPEAMVLQRNKLTLQKIFWIIQLSQLDQV